MINLGVERGERLWSPLGPGFNSRLAFRDKMHRLPRPISRFLCKNLREDIYFRAVHRFL